MLNQQPPFRMQILRRMGGQPVDIRQPLIRSHQRTRSLYRAEVPLSGAAPDLRAAPVHYGGPVQVDRGFVHRARHNPVATAMRDLAGQRASRAVTMT